MCGEPSFATSNVNVRNANVATYEKLTGSYHMYIDAKSIMSSCASDLRHSLQCTMFVVI